MSSAVERPMIRACDWLGPAAGGLTLPIRDLQLDSRQVGPGDAFIAVTGERSSGCEYVSQAVERGASLILLDAGEQPGLKQAGVPVIALDGLKTRLGELARQFYAQSSDNIQVVGITGTNGKTSVSYIMAQLLEALGHRCAVIGTLGWGFVGQQHDTGMTTPDVVSVHRILSRLAADGAAYVAMEVSSHGLQQGRVDGVDFSAAVFTNLSRDHLDYHGDMASYGASKRLLFTRSSQLAVCNLDDAFGDSLYRDPVISEPKLGYSLDKPLADVYCRELHYHARGCSAELHTPWGDGGLHSPLLGPHNLQNLLACITLLGGMGMALPDVLQAAAACSGAPGRMELVHHDKVRVIVDYAHTPDALEQLLLALKPHVEGSLRLVFGCGGNRDEGKRAIMGAVAERIADAIVLTSDNPRDEIPLSIIEAIRSGMTAQCRYLVEPDRAAAIATALDAAQAGDMVVIAGKGHEDYQEIKQHRYPFSDQQCVERYYAARQAAQ